MSSAKNTTWQVGMHEYIFKIVKLIKVLKLGLCFVKHAALWVVMRVVTTISNMWLLMNIDRLEMGGGIRQ